MENLFLIAGIIAFIFLLVKFMELRFVETEHKALKFLIRDTLVVYFCVITGYYLYDQFRPVTKSTITPVFTGSPDF
jgi:ABC-type arginine/histidine transport system permease subunit